MAPINDDVILSVNAMNTFYGKAQILFDVELTLKRGEVVVIGAHGEAVYFQWRKRPRWERDVFPIQGSRCRDSRRTSIRRHDSEISVNGPPGQ